MKVTMTACVHCVVTGVGATLVGEAQAFADELLRAITQLWCVTQWSGDYKQTVNVHPRTGDTINFTVTWEREY